MQSFSKKNKGYKYILSVIDIFSKYGWMIPLKDKTGKSVAKALESITRKPEKIWVDKGKEFYNKDVKFELYSTENEEKSSVVERWNRIMKEKMFKYFSANNTNKYIDVLQDLVEQYNNTVHSTTKMTPVEASLKKNEPKVYLNSYGIVTANVSTPKFKVGDRVRITIKKNTFEKGYTPRWTEEVFTISTVQPTQPVTYKIKDSMEDEIKGTFYEQELQKTKQDIYRIEKVLSKRNGKAFVKWIGYPTNANSWIPLEDIERI